MTLMKKILSLIALCGIGAFAQTVTPNTTICAAQTTTATSLCLTSTIGIYNQSSIYIDGELEVVYLSASQTIGTTNAYVPVVRAQRAGTVPGAHNSGAVAWIQPAASGGAVLGDNGFEYSTQYGDVGPCVRASFTYLPHIWPDRGVIRDCSGTGYWVTYDPNINNQFLGGSQFGLLTTNGAITVASGMYVITKAGVLADTLAAPTAGVQDGMIISIISSTADAHTLTATGLLQTGATYVNLATFAAHAGAGLTLMAYNGYWIVLYSNGITFS